MTTIPGKNVLLTGGSRGLGPVMAEALAQRGANIALAARSVEGLQQVARTLERYPVKVCTFPVDLSQLDSMDGLVNSVVDQLGSIDILINNAGLETEGLFLELPWEAIQENIAVNLTAPLALIRRVLPRMMERNQGHVVNIASIAARSGTPYAAIYSTTKAGLAEWTRALRLELHGRGVQFSTIFPGYVTEVGMFAKFNIKPPVVPGHCTPAQVARAVVRAIEKEKLELIVNSFPLEMIFLLSEAFPRLGDWMVLNLGAADFQRRKVTGK